MSDFKKLVVWQKAHAMALDAHRVAGQIRGTENLSLKSQIIRASMSVPANIVEGCGQQSRRGFSRFLKIAVNSTTELEYHLIASRDLRLVSDQASLSLLSQLIEVRKMIYGLLRHLASESEGKEGIPPREPAPS